LLTLVKSYHGSIPKFFLPALKSTVSGENFSQNFSEFSEFLYINFLTFSSHFLHELEHFSEKSTSFLRIFMKYCKISKIFCKYNFWWNVIKSKKYLKIFFKNYWWEISFVWKILREDVNFPNISEYFWKMFQFV